MNSSKRRWADMIQFDNPQFKKSSVAVRVSRETLDMVEELLEQYPVLYYNRSMLFEGALRRVYYLHKRGLMWDGFSPITDSVEPQKKKQRKSPLYTSYKEIKLKSLKDTYPKIY